MKNELIKAQAISRVDAGQSVRTVAKALGVNQGRVSEWTNGKSMQRQKDAIQDLRERFNEQFVTQAEEIITTALGEMSAKAGKANFAQLATGAGILIDKRQLLTGQPTSIVESQTDVESIKAAFMEALEESVLPIAEFLRFCVQEAEAEGDHELAKLLPQIIEVE